ncbi:MAG TPA: metallopeptidase family protein, partial [Myxococcota bacterium]|nr:metallopeptidase family protein [Myxococcota bacterium]
ARAAERYRRADQLLPDTATILAGWGIARFERAELDEAERLLRRAAALEGREPLPEVHHHLGLLLERQGQDGEAERHFVRARRLAPEAYPPPVRIPTPEFERLAGEAIDELAELLGVAELDARQAAALNNLVPRVLPFPALEDLRAVDPPHSPQLLGLFRGSALPQQSELGSPPQLPAFIELYQRNLERACRDRAELEEQIRVTVFHEVGHELGLDEDDLDRLGLA